MAIRERLARANFGAITADTDDASLGDKPGRIVRQVRSFAQMDKASFRKFVLTTVVGIFAGQAVVAALASASRNVRAIVSGFSGLVVLVLAIALAVGLLGRYVRVSKALFRRIAFVSALLLGFIILTGSAVRLTGSGLGCPDFPTCKSGDIIPSSGNHAAIEFGNRVVTGLCLLAATIGTLTALVRRPYRRDLVIYGTLVSVGLLGNALLGGLTVLFKLKPHLVMAHFVLAIACLTAGVVLVHRSSESASSDIFGRMRSNTVDLRMRQLANALVVCTLGVVLLGCVLTGSGPHGGDPGKVRRFGYSMLDVVRLHSGMVWVTLAIVVTIGIRVRNANSPATVELRRRIGILALIMVAQGAIGYAQWYNQVPALLVQFHILGAIAMWCGVLWVRAAVTAPANAHAGVTDKGARPGTMPGSASTNPLVVT
jgi:heme a synthase